MRTLVFLAVVFLAVVFLTAQTSFNSSPFVSQQSGQVTHMAASPRNDQPSRPGDGTRMWRRAEIRVVPLDVAVSDRAELGSLRSRVARVDADSAMISFSDPAAREQIEKQLQLIKSLLSYAERTQSDVGKSPTAIDVQRHLNDIEGKVNCEACHTGVVAKLAK